MIDISKLQQEELKILLEVRDVCKKNEIEYFLIYGTLLGAVRHKGFIPWDDDIDICMTRDNYNKFKQIFHSTKYKLHDYDTVKNYPYILPKVVNEEKRYKEKSISHLDYYCGTFIDIFIIDGVSNNNIKRKVDTFIVYLLYVIHRIFCKSKKKYIRKIFPIYYILKLYNGWYVKYDINKCNKCRLSQDLKEKNYMKSVLFTKSSRISFEGYMFNIPLNYDEILLFIYDKYMQLPAVEEQVSHHNIIEIPDARIETVQVK